MSLMCFTIKKIKERSVIRKTLSIAPVILLSGCLGSSIGSVSDETNTPVTLETFSDGSGVMRAEMNQVASGITGNVNKVVAISPDVSRWVSSLSAAEVKDLVDHNLPLVEDKFLDSANYYEGILTLAGESYTVSVFDALSGDGSVGFGSDKNGDALVAVTVGSEATNIPSGNFTYTGLHVVGAKQFQSGPSGEPLTTGSGTFTMTVNFDDETGTYSGSTHLINSTTLSGNLVLDNIKGEITGSNLPLTGSINGVSLNGKTAKLQGNFHGDGASSVTGVFYTDELAYGGGFVGQK